jgi:hypothetical protein
MAFVPAAGAMQAFIHRKNLETHRELLAESNGDAEPDEAGGQLAQAVATVPGVTKGAGK